MNIIPSNRVISGGSIMSYNFERLPGEGILIVTYHEDYSVRLHAAASVEEGTKLLDAEKTPIYFIIDAIAVSIDLDDLISSATLATRQTRFLTHPIIREIILVTRSKLLSLAAKGLDSVAFGHVKVRVFATRDDALNYARQTE
jgi:hypothetical protein